MGKKTGVFIEGQHVFAKVKGYSPWPAKITKVISKHKYGVYFYGTGETASVKSEDLDPYDEKHRERFNTDRQLKKGEYKEAVDQIQAAIEGNDPAPLTMDLSKNNVTADSITDNDNSADESQLHIAEEIPKTTPLPQKRKPAAVKVKQETPQVATPEPADAKENDEKVSRSGRKIKEKKMNTDEMDPDEMFTQPRKRMKLDEGKQKLSVTSVDSKNALDDFRAAKMHILLDPIKMKPLENQYDMITAMQKIKLDLGLEKAEIDHSIDLLENFNENILPHITKLMLLKYPNTVDTIKRLKKYVGNSDKWKMDETEEKEFHAKATKIRNTASLVYDAFKELFNYQDDASFWNKFAEEQQAFQQKYNKLSPADLFEGLSYEELDSLLNNQQQITDLVEDSTISAQPDALSIEASIEPESETPAEETVAQTVEATN